MLENYLPGVASQLLSLPQRAIEAAGNFQRTGEYDPAPAVETALMTVGAGGMPAAAVRRGMAARGGELPSGATNPMASRNASLYNPPAKLQRPFELDYPPAKYPQGVPADATGRLAYDIEGRPLAAERVVGRRTLGGPDEALSPAGVQSIGEGSVGARYTTVPAGTLGGDAGRLVITPGPERTSYDVLLNQRLRPQQLDRVAAHETGHLIDELVGRIPTAGLGTELRQVFNTLNTGQERTRHLTGPQHMGYSEPNVPRELIVEAIRGYMADPNYLKTVAPKTAAAIREAVNSNPRLNRTIQS